MINLISNVIRIKDDEIYSKDGQTYTHEIEEKKKHTYIYKSYGSVYNCLQMMADSIKQKTDTQQKKLKHNTARKTKLFFFE